MFPWVLALVVVLLLVVGAVGVTLLRRGDTDSAACGRSVSVVADPAVAPAVIEAVKRIGGPDCATYDVTTRESADAAQAVKDGTLVADVWLPASTGWLTTADATAHGYPATGTSVARSPLVLAMPAPVQQTLTAAKVPPSWAGVAAAAASGKGVQLSMPSAVRTTTGMLSVLAVRAAMAKTTTDPGIAQMRALGLRSKVAPGDADTDAILAELAAGRPAAGQPGVLPLTEQQLWSYDQSSPAVPLTATYPADASVDADFPLVVATAANPDTRAAVDKLRDQLTAPDFTGVLTGGGLRPASGDAVPSGRPQTYPAVTKVAFAEAPAATDTWNRYRTTPFQVLVLLDGSGSMNEKVRDKAGTERTKVELFRLAGQQTTALFGDETSLAVWRFDTSSAKRPYTELLPFGPVEGKLGSGTRREAASAVVKNFSAQRGGGTPLYASVLNAASAMGKRWKPDAFTMVVVVSDGKDQDSPFSMSTKDFLGRLKKVEDPTKPVPVFTIGYGADADMDSLTAMSEATGARALNSTEPGDLAGAIAQVFLAVHK